jgi:hypothetical protein
MSAARSKQSQSIYGVHPGVMMVQKWISELKVKTGRSLDEWVALAKKGPASEQERREWLKIQHKLGTNSAWWVAARVEGKVSEEDSPESYLAAAPKYVEEQYSGKKASLRPLYENVLRVAAKLVLTSKRAHAKRSFRYTVITYLRSSSQQPTHDSIWAFRSRVTKANCRNTWWIPAAWQRKIVLPTGSDWRRKKTSTRMSRSG